VAARSPSSSRYARRRPLAFAETWWGGSPRAADVVKVRPCGEGFVVASTPSGGGGSG